MERLDEDLRREKEAEAKRVAEDEARGMTELDMGILERREVVERVWGRGTQGLVELGKIPGVLAKLERAERAAEVVENM